MFKKKIDEKEFEVLSMDGDMTLIHDVNKKCQPWIVVNGLDINHMTWSAGHYFSTYEEAHNFFINEINEYDANQYRNMFKSVLKCELEAQGFYKVSNEELDMLFSSFMKKDFYTTIMNTELLNDLMEELQFIRCPDLDSMGTIMKDMFELAKYSDNFTWFIESDEKKQYSKQEWEQFTEDLKRLDETVDGMDSIIECPRDADILLQDIHDPLVTFYGAFLRLFDKELYEQKLENYEENQEQEDESWCI